uniref:Uncharacterized protein n=1 Tax=Ciona intestinalis TaxID=7719 RepID=H2XZU5_CIOIN
MLRSNSHNFERISTLYGSMALFLTVVHNVFLLYYVEMFVTVYKIDKTSFWIGEIAFLVWNSTMPQTTAPSPRTVFLVSNYFH